MGGWELFCVGRGENTDGMSTDNPGDKPECWTFGKLGPAPNGDTLPEASSPPCMAVTKGLPQREHSMGPGKKPRARHKFFVSGSSVFWSRLSSSPHRRTPSLCQGQQREGERETGECKGGRVGGCWRQGELSHCTVRVRERDREMTGLCRYTTGHVGTHGQGVWS